jgi:UDP-N-acetylglucosamine 2-epimerase
MAGRKPTAISIVGARPQFIKLAPLAKSLRGKCRHIIIHSGQHYDYELSQAFFDQLSIPKPDINLNVGSGNHGRQTGRILERCEKALISFQPDMVLVYGDTNTTLAGALAAAKLGIPVGHIEAGLRSFRRTMPEEINRVMADHLSGLLFYPTPTARNNLKREGITKGLIRSGDLMFEILDSCLPIIARRKNILKKHGVNADEYLLITLHRAENVDDPRRLDRFIDVMANIERPKLYLAHPRTIKNLKRFGLNHRIKKVDGLIVSRPQPYIETLTLMSGAAAVMTDSGGIQKEACFLGRPCLTLRPETEWVETVESGANFLVDMSLPKIRRVLNKKLPRRRVRQYMIKGKKPSEIIGAAIVDYLRNRK